MNSSKFKNSVRLFAYLRRLIGYTPTFRLNFIIKPMQAHCEFTKYSAIPTLLAGIFSNIFKKNEEVSEEQLIATIKRSLVFVERQDFEKAEEVLQSALKIAQELNSNEGITFIYDVMASLAIESEDFVKASQLLSNVMDRLREEGHEEDSAKILHIYSKIAQVHQLRGDYKQAKREFTNTIEKIEKKLAMEDDIELRELLGQTKTRFGQLFMKLEDFKEAKDCFLGAYDAYTRVYGKVNSEAVAVLHYLSLSCKHLSSNGEAIKYMEEAIELAEQLQEVSDVALMKAQLGLLYLKVNMLDRARESCRYAMKLGRKYDNYFGIVKAKECLNKIRETATVTKSE